jgi:hypothetical protein
MRSRKLRRLNLQVRKNLSTDDRSIKGKWSLEGRLPLLESQVLLYEHLNVHKVIAKFGVAALGSPRNEIDLITDGLNRGSATLEYRSMLREVFAPNPKLISRLALSHGKNTSTYYSLLIFHARVAEPIDHSGLGGADFNPVGAIELYLLVKLFGEFNRFLADILYAIELALKGEFP